MHRANRPAFMRWLLLSIAVLATACMDQGAGFDPHVPSDEEAQLRVHVELSSTSVATVAVEVTAADMEPLTFELTIADGAASGSITLPAGSDRVITMRAYDSASIETHRGTTTVDIEGGSNPEISLTLQPLTGEQPIEAVMSEVVLESVSPAGLIHLREDTVQLSAQVVDSDGLAIDVQVRWAVVEPSAAEVTPEGQVWLTDPTLDSHTATVVAVLGDQVRSAEVTFMSAAGIKQHVERHLDEAFMNWWWMTGNWDNGGPAASTASFQHSAWPANFGMLHYSAIPRLSVNNDPAVNYYGVVHYAFQNGYKAIGKVNQAYEEMQHFLDRGMFDPADEARVRGVGSYLQGISYGYLAVRYDGGPIVGSLTDVAEATTFGDYTELLQTALVLLDESIAHAGATTFEVPAGILETPAPVSSEVLARAAHSFKARIRAGVARTPDERAAVNWNEVLADIGNGVQTDFGYAMNYPDIWHGSLFYTTHPGWAQMNYFVHGMADQSGRYQEWMSLPVTDRHPNLPSGAFLISTPDTRFPQGATVDDQMSNPGARFHLPSDYTRGWSAEGRGTWRWSYYRTTANPEMAQWGFLPDLSTEEMDLLAAEAHLRLGAPATAATLVNATRTAAGLTATDAAGTNADCVPRLPGGSCGDLMEMIKWEKRMEASHTNAAYMMGTWYYEGRGWGDLMADTPLHFPIPAEYAEHFGLPVVSYGGGLGFSAAVGTYGY